MNEHLPIQRWTKVFTRYPASEVLPNESGDYVTYNDHLAELRACEERVLLAAEKRHEGELAGEWQHGVTAGKVLGYADALDAVREAVANFIAVWDQDGWNVCSHKDALAAIDALREEKP